MLFPVRCAKPSSQFLFFLKINSQTLTSSCLAIWCLLRCDFEWNCCFYIFLPQLIVWYFDVPSAMFWLLLLFDVLSQQLDPIYILKHQTSPLLPLLLQSSILIILLDMLGHWCHGSSLPSCDLDCLSILPKRHCLVKWQSCGCRIWSHCNYSGKCNPITLRWSHICHILRVMIVYVWNMDKPNLALTMPVFSYSRTQLRLMDPVDWLDFVAVTLFL
jgi:hypothetical protein